MDHEVLFPLYYRQVVMKSNQIANCKLDLVNCRMCLVASKVRKEGENKNTKWENSRDRYEYGTKDIKNRVRKKKVNVSSPMKYL